MVLSLTHHLSTFSLKLTSAYYDRARAAAGEKFDGLIEISDGKEVILKYDSHNLMKFSITLGACYKFQIL